MPEADVSSPAVAPAPDAALRTRVEGRRWYHTIELAPDLLTPGWFDCRPLATRILPRSCEGQRCLDVGTFDGFWAFEMERRGAGEVIAIDILDESRWDWPAGTKPSDRVAIEDRKGGGEGFLIAKEQLGSNVARLDESVYELDPAIHGRFDLIYLGSLLLHLRDPVGALERVRAVCAGTLIAVDAISLPLSMLVPTPVANLDGSGRPYWWKPNAKGFRQMLSVSGFHVMTGPKLLRMRPGPGFPQVMLSRAALRTRQGRELWFASRFGDPHAYALARPR